MTKRTLLLLAVAVAVAPLAGCGRAGGATLPAPAAATPATAALGVKTVRARADGAVVRATGELRARNEAALAAEVSGRILRFHADVGERVKKGAVLVELDDAMARAQAQQARAAVAAAEAAHENAASEHRRAEVLTKGDAASPATLERAGIGERQAAATLEQARAALTAAETVLSKHLIRAPFDGVVTTRTKSAGEYVANMPPTPVIALVDVGSLEVRASVPETVVDLLSVGDVLQATVSPSGRPFRARIRAIGAAVEPGTRTVDVRADALAPAPKELRPGAIVEVALGAKGARPAGVYLPASVVQRDGGAAFVWTVAGDALARRAVTVEPLDPGTVRVVSGLSGAEAVVTEAGGALAEGAKVRVLP
jgi:RND family efflux transporter MFP subunit